MKRILTIMSELITMTLVGQTEAGSAEVQPARDSQLKATNCRWGGSLIPAIPFYEQRQFRALLCLKKPDKTAPPKAGSVSAEGRKSLLTVKRICPIHAEPVQSGKNMFCLHRACPERSEWVEAAFKSLKSDLAVRPVHHHQLEHRVEAHIFVAFLAYCLMVTLRQKLRCYAPGLTSKDVLDKLGAIMMIDVLIPTTDGRILQMRRYSQPELEQRIILD
ncbi:MAG: hypothetical protein ABIG61_10060, partial [Planctomycetota bacterium]